MNVVIAQSDVATAYGWGLDALWNGLLSNRTAIRSTDRFAQRGFLSNQAAIVPGLEVSPQESRALAMLKRLLFPLIGKLDPKTPLILATTVGEIEYVEWAILNHRPDLALQSRPQVLLGRIKHLLGLVGPATVISSACASSAIALARAAAAIRRGDAKKVLVVTCDSISEFVYSGFSTLLSLCDEPARPFDAERSGLTLGEAAAWALLESNDSPDDRAMSILGWGNTTDAVHMTAPDRNARGLSRAIAKACSMAGRTAGEISFIAAHGTATMYSDAMELLAFSAATAAPKPIFSVKGGIGHTLASAGLVQILIAGRAMSLGLVPPTVGLAVPDPAAAAWVHNTPVDLGRAPLALSTSSGFGGVNTAVLLGGAEQS
ncbi:MAG TPA: beta-ketoacyl synthase N-terminal-like domain-containing protein [Tepidisphaeraceae bacterium]|jgi:3-oxoacyl-[acyl-carrier-protein] synthase II|nr:beta-ketoacyl synthase N-terminal-like domain-containing protein [Tepidisphaeraceae bacterium]